MFPPMRRSKDIIAYDGLGPLPAIRTAHRNGTHTWDSGTALVSRSGLEKPSSLTFFPAGMTKAHHPSKSSAPCRTEKHLDRGSGPENFLKGSLSSDHQRIATRRHVAIMARSSMRRRADVETDDADWPAPRILANQRDRVSISRRRTWPSARGDCSYFATPCACLLEWRCGPVAQWIEQGTPKPQVGGSIPSGPASPHRHGVSHFRPLRNPSKKPLLTPGSRPWKHSCSTRGFQDVLRPRYAPLDGG